MSVSNSVTSIELASAPPPASPYTASPVRPPASVPAFACTACGRCCHGLRLPLSVAEALDWAANGGTVELWCDAAPDLGPPQDAAARHRWAGGFAAHSGSMAIRVSLTPVAAFDGACPRLLPDRRCGAYDRRPDACRIYPAEVRPDRVIDPADKLCPPEAWGIAAASDAPDAATAAAPAIRALVAARHDDRSIKARLAQRLGLADVALANEGSVVVVPEGQRLIAAIRAALPPNDAPATDWRFVTAAATTAALIADAGGTVGGVEPSAGARYETFVRPR